MAVQKKPSSLRAAIKKANPDESWIACYDENGQLVGICPPDAITPVANGGSVAPKAQQPKAKTAPAQAPAASSPEAEAMAKQRRTVNMRKGLYGGASAPEQVDLANALNQAAIVGLDVIHGRRLPRRG